MYTKTEKVIEGAAIFIMTAAIVFMLTSCGSEEEIVPANAAKSQSPAVTYSVTAASGVCLDGAQLMAWVDVDDKLDQASAFNCGQAQGSATLSKGDVLELHVYGEYKSTVEKKIAGTSFTFTVTQNGTSETFTATGSAHVKYNIK
jgi:hypothetical protein